MGQHWVSGEGGRDGTALGEWGGRGVADVPVLQFITHLISSLPRQGIEYPSPTMDAFLNLHAH